MSAKSGKRVACLALVVSMAAISGCGLTGARDAGPAPAIGSADGADTGLRPPVPAAAAAAWARAEAAMIAANWAGAEAVLSDLVRDYPRFAGPHVNLAIVQRQLGRDEAAEAALSAAVALEPNHPAANSELGRLLRERGDFDAAEQAYRRALLGDPGYRYAHYNLGVLLDVYLQRRDEAVEHYETYQSLVAEPDSQVQFWIADLRRRLEVAELANEPVQVARENGE